MISDEEVEAAAKAIYDAELEYNQPRAVPWHEQFGCDKEQYLRQARAVLSLHESRSMTLQCERVLSEYRADLADADHNPDAPGDFAIAALKKIDAEVERRNCPFNPAFTTAKSQETPAAQQLSTSDGQAE